MRLGRAGGSAAAVTACTAAKQNDHIPCLRALTAYILLRGGADDRANFHALSGISIVI